MKGKTRKLIKLARRGNQDALLELKRRASGRRDKRALRFVQQHP